MHSGLPLICFPVPTPNSVEVFMQDRT